METTELILTATQRIALVRSDLEAARDQSNPVLALTIGRACAEAQSLQTLLLAVTDALIATDNPPAYLNLRRMARPSNADLDRDR